MYEFAETMYVDETALGRKSTRDKSPIRLLKSPVIMISASGFSSYHKKKSFSKTRFLSSELNDLCDRIKLLLQEKKPGNKSEMNNEENLAIAGKFLEYKCKSTNQKKFRELNV